ncbi:dimethylarginine dimethylaminohydrolase family protein [Streptococcus macacae]|uniref:Amidinotransferase domain protein n=1 Tax=Streptococcus macacae NCTC 11558 TaxID=764298 RepID=G5JV55_9STRE|nr:arginine deiminase family protein [Streptococcus macacae]EHJ52606.1 amidinotransferase domain protein [Streptococcus macacae NCTC 11558]SUN77680.1 amidinotransferase [Streptococcus macacae NCTC 11558]
MKITIYNEYAPLKTVIIGDASRLFFPDSHAIENEKSKPWWEKLRNNIIFPLLRGKEVPRFLTKHFQKELDDFEQLLRENQVTVLKVDAITPPASKNPAELGTGQMYARDSAMSIGDLFIQGNIQIEMRKKERLGYQRIVQNIKENNKVVTMSQSDPVYLEGGDVIVDYPNVFVGIGKYASNLAGIEWLRKQLDDSWNIVPVYLNDDGILHLDCCMTIIGPKTAIICREVLKDLPKELSDYTFINIDKKVRQEMAGNVLVLGHNKVIVQKRHKKLQEDLRKHGFTPLPLSFTWHALLEGAFRCASCPLERE